MVVCAGGRSRLLWHSEEVNGVAKGRYQRGALGRASGAEEEVMLKVEEKSVVEEENETENEESESE